jgi:tetratricopeptide (TPR) repeat protein
MTDDLYERYKATLRAGHVALLRGSLQEAAEEYRIAVAVAPSRALPHTSLGGVFMRQGNLQDALAEYSQAVNLAPNDEGALLGLAEALSLAGQRVDAAAALDRVAEVREASGRLPEAADTLRRGLGLEDSPERLQRHRALVRRIRMSEGDQVAEQLLARALRLREEPSGSAVANPRGLVSEAVAAEVASPAVMPGLARAEAFEEAAPAEAASEGAVEAAAASSVGDESVVAVAVVEPESSEGLASDAATLEEAVVLRGQGFEAGSTFAESPQARTGELSEAEAEPFAEPEPTPGPIAEFEAGPAADAAPPGEGEGEPAAAPAVEAEPAAISPNGPCVVESDVFALPEEVEPPVVVVTEQAPEAALRGGGAEVQRQPTGDELLGAAEAAEVSGDLKALRSLLVWTARAYAREGRFEAALDAAHRLLQRYPGDVDAHLVLVELYVARDWDTLAIDKLTLLDRLAQLGEDEPTHERLRAVATRAFAGDPRLSSILGA